jgi:hypothetical protein
MFYDPNASEVASEVAEVADAFKALAIRNLGRLDQLGSLDTYEHEVRPNMVAAAVSATVFVFVKAGKMTEEAASHLTEGIAIMTQILADNEAGV